MKKRYFSLILICLLTVSAFALADDMDLQAFAQRLSPVFRRVLCADGALYAVNEEHELYRFSLQGEKGERVTQLPKLSAAEKDRLGAEGFVPPQLLAAPEGLWYLDAANERLGKVEETGIRWTEHGIPKSMLPDEAEATSLSAFMQQGVLFLLADNTANMSAIDPATGSCKKITLAREAEKMIPYRAGHALAQVYREPTKENPYECELWVIDLATGTMRPLPNRLARLNVSSADAQVLMIRLSYDAERDTVYYKLFGGGFEENDALCRAQGEQDFEVFTCPMPDASDVLVLPSDQGLLLRYADRAVRFVREDALCQTGKTVLTVKGDFLDAEGILREFTRANPDVQVRHVEEDVSREDRNALLTDDASADIYVMYANRMFDRIKEKGYAAPLDGGVTAHPNVAKMDEKIRSVLCAKDGTWRAVPGDEMLLELTAISPYLWEKLPAGTVKPTTYREALALMAYWHQSGLAQEHKAVCYGPYSPEGLLQEIIFQHIAEQEQAGQPLTFDTPAFRETLDSFTAFWKSLDKEEFKTMQAESEDYLFFGGGMYVDEGAPFLRADAAFPFTALGIEKTEQPKIRTEMNVMFINARSEHQEEAKRLLTYWLNRQLDRPEMAHACGIHEQTAVENRGYAAKKQALDQKRQEIEAAKSKAEGADVKAFEEMLRETALEEEKLEKDRWSVTPEGVERLIPMQRQMVFYGSSLYRSTNDREHSFMKKMDELTGRFVSGQFDAQGLVSGLDAACRMIALESR